MEKYKAKAKCVGVSHYIVKGKWAQTHMYVFQDIEDDKKSYFYLSSTYHELYVDQEYEFEYTEPIKYGNMIQIKRVKFFKKTYTIGIYDNQHNEVAFFEPDTIGAHEAENIALHEFYSVDNTPYDCRSIYYAAVKA